jgi:Domain of Unknown Function (DUF1080)
MRLLLIGLLALAQLPAASRLFNGKDLTGWEVAGEGLWTVTRDGVIVGQFDYKHEGTRQSWLVTKDNFTDFRLTFEFWIPRGTNSGIAVRDPTRAKAERPPSFSGYEIQLIDWPGYEWTTGSIFRFAKAKAEPLRSREWNRMEVEVKGAHFKVMVNGVLVSELEDATRPGPGPIEFQLHDKTALLMLRNIEVEKWK